MPIEDSLEASVSWCAIQQVHLLLVSAWIVSYEFIISINRPPSSRHTSSQGLHSHNLIKWIFDIRLYIVVIRINLTFYLNFI